MQRTTLRHFTIEKKVGETPLEALERGRTLHQIPAKTPLAYAGRLDPMASGTLLILVGDECKSQKKYHVFDKEYKVELLLSVRSDSGDVLGIVEGAEHKIVTKKDIERVFKKVVGSITLPYPHFSAKTVKGKPLHMWTLEQKLSEIEVPLKHSYIHQITLTGIETYTKSELLKKVRTKIESIPQVTDPRKALGADFRRDSVRAAWNTIEESGLEVFEVIQFTCIASSGTYMRSLAEHIASELGTSGLALSIHRTIIGRYVPVTHSWGFWLKRFTT